MNDKEKMMELLASKDACSGALQWCSTQRDLATAWAVCERADWLLWLAGRLEIDRKTLVRAANECARTALKYLSECEDRPRRCVEVVARWCNGEATIQEVLQVRDAFYFYASYASYTSYTSVVVAAAASADAAAYTADAAASAAFYAASESYAASAIREQALKEMADIVRAQISWSIIEAKV